MQNASKKIPLKTSPETVQELVQQFWALQNQWNGRKCLGPSFTVHQANTILNKIIYNMAMPKRFRQQAVLFQTHLITAKRRSKQTKHKTLIQFPRKSVLIKQEQ